MPGSPLNRSPTALAPATALSSVGWGARLRPLTTLWPLQVGCNKVYTSTSDVMTHENFHKKNTQLINDGFQRFRATEDCGTADCQFYGQKTTHFHCR